jgi:DNA repair protein SbcC/Rad50
MIPQRVRLSGFLSYKDEQEVHFAGAQLWMLTGANGSGKSSIFDAVTFALFGYHRGGSTGNGELINRNSSTLSVEFDFLLEDTLYRIKRTLRSLKNTVKSTVQLLRREDDGSWNAIPGTDQRTKFEAWVRDKIGLDYETFTSSVLLLQGKAEKLLDTTPSGRAGVLARIVDLERYQKLHAAVDEQRREFKALLEGVENQLSGLKEVDDEEYGAAAARIADIELGRTGMQERIDGLLTLELQSLRWTDAQDKLAGARSKLSSAESLLGHAVAIENDHARLRELHDVFPAIGIIVTEKGRIADSGRKTEQFAKERAGKADSRRHTEHALQQARQKLAALKKTLAEDEAKQAKLNTELRELSAVLEKVRQAEEAEAEVKRLETELKRLPANLDATIRTLEDEQTRLAVVAQAVPLLDRLYKERTELLQATHREAAAKKDEDRLLAEGHEAKKEVDRLQAELAAVSAQREAAAAAMAEARALAQQAKNLADDFKKLSSDKTCTACGQELTKEHFEKEKKRRDLEAKVTERKLHDVTKHATEAREKEDTLVVKEAAARARVEKLRESFQDKSGEAKQAAAEIGKLRESCKQSYIALPESFRERVAPCTPADWTTVAYPERHELTALRAEAASVDDVRRKLREAAAAANNVRTVRVQFESARERHDKLKLGLPSGDPAALRQQYASKQTDDTTLVNAIKGTKKEILQTELDVDRQQRMLGEIDRDLVELDGKLNLEDSTRKQSQEAIDRAKKTLPESWQEPLEHAGFAERSKWQNEFDALTAKATENKYTQLQAARGGLDSLRAEIDLLQQEADAFPEPARRAPDGVKAELAAARAELDRCNAELLDAQRARGILDEYRRQRMELGQQFKSLDADHNRRKRLAELLGRDRLQRHLVRKAERQIVDCANGVLDRLSDGVLFLKLVGSDDQSSTEKALELECYNRATGGTAINVAFLSGSQRFRVAVALALGIGQYASKQFRPIESVIIDEGFGCLDRAGRQVMIQELQNLRGHLKSILLVSHQEEFADAFPDGYRFELVNGATQVKRIQK